MTKPEALFYTLLYAYVFLGFGYFFNKLINYPGKGLERRRDPAREGHDGEVEHR